MRSTATPLPTPTSTPLTGGSLGLDFGVTGNGAEVLWAGVFTLVGIVVSVVIALAIQRADFTKRGDELRTTARLGYEADLISWRRSIAERAIGIITRVAVEAGKSHSTPWWILRNEIDDIHTMLHLDPEKGGAVLGEWLIATCKELWMMRPVTQGTIDDLMEAASAARAKVMVWAIYPNSPTTDEGMMNLAKQAFSSHDGMS